ncbi:hypothetical protein [Nocardia flavorosea]|uniref:Uncharacterized protein n=1 Tax=Nocardia flavorosea TaxID=53429 RepID=A0A846YLA7_9NOCA|nr:hypothetical protein [Nocardia flavorosea]NKY60426.1 hypothetical protein [Nocardia flavorosea]
MPRTVDHIVATHQLAAERRKAGKPIWDETIDVSRVWNDDDLSFEEKRDAIVAQFKRSRWFRDDDEFGRVREIVDEEIAYAEDVDEFDGWWDELYDLADYDRIWIKTV